GPSAGTLAPTLEMTDVDGVPVAFQADMPVPSFGWQPRPRIDLDGPWRMERQDLDPALTMSDREATLEAIEAEAGGRQLPDHDDGAWVTLAVPGTFNPPPDGAEGGAWYRRAVDVPSDWAGQSVTLRFGAVNYVADVWLNGAWLGHHEGGATPFAFDVGPVLRPGEQNTVAVRAHAIPIGTRSDVVPWALVDWWNYGGITGSVWLEAAPPVHVARADVRPHLDALEIGVVLWQADQLAGRTNPTAPIEDAEATASLRASILPAQVTDANLLEPDPRALVAPGTEPFITTEQDVVFPDPGEARAASFSIAFRDADLWTPATPALYVLRIELRPTDRPLDAREARQSDTYWATFGIRHVSVDPLRPRVLLNGEGAFFRGVGIHAETLGFDATGALVSGTPYQAPRDVLAELRQARAVGADLLRTGHQPGDPTMLMLADRLGFAVWEEIPLYHATPVIFERTMERGIPQQMVREMALRDMNHPAVLFHGFANESTGTDERADALAELHEVDREIDGTRLTGQAAYGWQPDDPTHEPLDVAGYTMYHGVFYGDDAGPDTRRALREAHEAHPDKPILALEFGRWADAPIDEARQRAIFEDTYAALEHYRADRPSGFVSAATWWTLHDFATQLPGIGVEDFGLFRPDGGLRAAGMLAARSFDAPAGGGAEQALEPELERPRVLPQPEVGDWTLALYLAYGLGFAVATMSLALVVLTRRGGRALGRAR
ncbi:MAG TPA: glycoside hydrolase family 2 TIM barrel-domain containing protein, partial [Candidatus Limnocylindria bacterium]|nr:glycoside hydrolase family 2 TIM barrel-domain containing protein [Candidatus Limnocylindria bacterium]